MIENPLLQNKSEITSKVLGEKILNFLDKTFVVPQTFDYNVIKVTSDFIGRMDLISKQVYGTNKYQDLLCKLNGISNPFELNEDTILVLPSISELAKFYYMEKSEDLENDANSDINRKPVAKGKKEKRKPNEAVIGEKRFRIDPTRKVIVY